MKKNIIISRPPFVLLLSRYVLMNQFLNNASLEKIKISWLPAIHKTFFGTESLPDAFFFNEIYCECLSIKDRIRRAIR